MKKVDEAKPEYDFSKGERGKHSARYREGTNVVLIDEDLVEMFPTSKSVNDALRKIVKQTADLESVIKALEALGVPSSEAKRAAVSAIATETKVVDLMDALRQSATTVREKNSA